MARDRRAIVLSVTALAAVWSGCAGGGGAGGASPSTDAGQDGVIADAASVPADAGGDGGCPGAALPLAIDPDNCGRCGRSCLGGACVEGQCQPVPIVTGKSAPNWDGVYPYGIALATDAIYYSDGVRGVGFVWKVSKQGGIPEIAIPNEGAEAFAEYCLVDGGGENAGWLATRTGHVHWHGCMDRLRDLDVATGETTRIGTLAVSYIATSETAVFGTRQRAVAMATMGEVVELTLADGVETVLASYQGRPRYLALDADHVYWSDLDGPIMRAAQGAAGGAEPVAMGTAPEGIAVDDAYVYWTEPSRGAVVRANKVGGVVETIATGQDQPVQILVDGDFVYWTNTSDYGPGAVMRVRKDGSSAPAVLATGQGMMAGQHRGPWALAVDERAVYWTELFGAGAVMKVAK